MQKRASPVKSRVYWGCVMLLSSCASVGGKPVSHPNYLSQDLPVDRYERLRSQVEAKTHENLKNRGEAHITVITPPEWDLLKEKLQMSEIEDIARRNEIARAPFEEVCIGRGDKIENGRALRTYFVVVRAPTLVRIRHEVENLARTRGGSGAFVADHFFPHITLGFTERDLHEQDGVVKDKRACDPRLAL